METKKKPEVIVELKLKKPSPSASMKLRGVMYNFSADIAALAADRYSITKSSK